MLGGGGGGTLTCSANLAVVEEDTKVSSLDSSGHISVGEDDVGGLAAQLEGNPLQVGVSCRAHDQVTNFGTAYELNCKSISID